MTSLTLHRHDLESEIAELLRLENELTARRAELAELQSDVQIFRRRYVETIGSRLAELAELERELVIAERLHAGEREEEDETAEDGEDDFNRRTNTPSARGARKLFWSIAKLFHPDYANDEEERERRHTIMAEASRAYTDGDEERLTELLSDDRLISSCVTTRGGDEEITFAARLSQVKEQLSTVEFGIRRIKQDGLYRMKLRVDEDAARGRDALAEMESRVNKTIIQTRRKLEQLS